MNSRERVLAMLEGRAVDRLPLMPITMMLAADCAGVPYGRYATDFRGWPRGSSARPSATASITFPAFRTRPAKRPTAARRSISSTTSRRPSMRSIRSWPTSRSSAGCGSPIRPPARG